MSKGKGWYGDRHRHKLASMGVKTTLNPSVVRFRGRDYLEADGVLYTPRNEFVNSVNGQIRCLSAYGMKEDWDDPDFYDTWGNDSDTTIPQKQTQTQTVIPIEGTPDLSPPTEDYVPPPPSPENDSRWYDDAGEKLEEANKEVDYTKDQSKYASKMVKITEKKEEAIDKGIEKDAKKEMREAQVKAGVGVGGAKELLTEAGKSIWKGVKKFFTASPSDVRPPVSSNMGKKGMLGAINTKRNTDTAKPKSPAGYSDVTKEMYKSVDADSMIATIENKEKLIGFANDLEHDINLLDVSHKKNYNEFRTEERKDSKLFMIDYRKAKSELRDEIDIIKTTGQKESCMRSEVDNLKTVFEFNMNKLKNALKTQKMQHRVDLKYIDDLKDDLGKLHKQTDKRIKQMVASGVRK